MPVVAATKINFGGSKNFALSIHASLQRAGLSDAAARLLTAHIALSTGWGKSVDNYRLAGVKADATWRASKPYVVAKSCECKAGYPNDPSSKYQCASGTGQKCSSMYWRAYNTLDDAARDLVNLLRQSRYASAYAYLVAGDPEYFAQVGRDGWYTADTAKTKASMVKNLNTINGYLGGASDSGGLLTAALIVGAIWYYKTHVA
jgi:flagellum-specific peptidoglycan hydrolase FlgJ